jgi:CubicO group peptidase (beta-lactamase class C family)
MDDSMVSVSRRQLLGASAAMATLPAAASAAGRGSWSQAELDAFRARARDLQVRGLVVLSGGRTLVSDGDVDKPFRIASVRKSFLCALYGMAVAEKTLQLDLSLADLGIDDYQPLSPTERSATVRQLLQARSGVYIPSSAETAAMKAARPARGSHPPGSFWYYNNWDFNALGEIYQRQTGVGLFTAFEHRLAGPLGLRDFVPLRDSRWDYDRQSPRFPAYDLFLSARDMATFGQLYLNRGAWQGRQLVPAAWVDETTRPISPTGDAGLESGYGHLWWGDIDRAKSGLPPGSYTAAGNGGRYITILPALDAVVATQPFEEPGKPQARVYTEPGAYNDLIRRLAAAWRA